MGTDIDFVVEPSGVAVLTLNRPTKLNALTRDMVRELMSLVLQAERDSAVRAAILTGAGRAFCAGADIDDQLGPLLNGDRKLWQDDLKQVIGEVAITLSELSKPIVAAVNGVVAGMGVALAAICDFRLASEEARFQSGFVQRGIMPDCGLPHSLVRLIGLPKALEFMLLGDSLSAIEAHRIGLVNKVTPSELLMPSSMQLAEKLAEAAPVAVSFTKRASYRALTSTLKEELEFESWGQGVCFLTEDFKEGVRSFIEKRPPTFRGR